VILRRRLESERVEDGGERAGVPTPRRPCKDERQDHIGFLPPRVSRQHKLINEQSTIRSPRKS
jgi:hypothetical protein